MSLPTLVALMTDRDGAGPSTGLGATVVTDLLTPTTNVDRCHRTSTYTYTCYRHTHILVIAESAGSRCPCHRGMVLDLLSVLHSISQTVPHSHQPHPPHQLSLARPYHCCWSYVGTPSAPHLCLPTSTAGRSSLFLVRRCPQCPSSPCSSPRR